MIFFTIRNSIIGDIIKKGALMNVHFISYLPSFYFSPPHLPAFLKICPWANFLPTL